jgi:hypothetical protein
MNCNVLEYWRSLSTSSLTAAILFRIRFSFFSFSSWSRSGSSVPRDGRPGQETGLVNSTPTPLCCSPPLRGAHLDNVETTAPLPLATRFCFGGFLLSVCCGANGAAAAEGTVDMSGVGKTGSQSVSGSERRLMAFKRSGRGHSPMATSWTA